MCGCHVGHVMVVEIVLIVMGLDNILAQEEMAVLTQLINVCLAMVMVSAKYVWVHAGITKNNNIKYDKNHINIF